MHHNCTGDGALGVECENTQKIWEGERKMGFDVEGRSGNWIRLIIPFTSDWGKRYLVSNHNVLLWLLRWNKGMATASLTNYNQQLGEKSGNRTGIYKSNFFNAIHTVKFFEKHKQGPKLSTETSKSQSSRHNTYSGPLPIEAAALNSFRFIRLCSF